MPGDFPRPYRLAGVLLIAATLAAGSIASAAVVPAPVDAKLVRKRTKIAPVTSKKRVAETRGPALQLHDEGALGYDWKEWRSLSTTRDVRLRWRLGVVAAGAARGTAFDTLEPGGPSLSPLFEPEKSRSQLLITDTPLHRDGVLTIGVRVEF